MSTLAENVAKVTAAHAALKTAIAAKGVAVPEGTKLSGMPALVGQISTEPEPTNPRASFAYDESASIVVPKTLVVDMMSVTNIQYFFTKNSSLTSLVLPEGFGLNAKNISGILDGCTSITSVVFPVGFGRNAERGHSLFYGCKSLVSVHLPDGFGEKITISLANAFYNCPNLENITGNPNFKISFDLSPCQKLIHDSLMVVINGLQTVTTTKTLTLGSTNLAKLTDEEKKVATDKGWTLA